MVRSWEISWENGLNLSFSYQLIEYIILRTTWYIYHLPDSVFCPDGRQFWKLLLQQLFTWSPNTMMVLYNTWTVIICILQTIKRTFLVISKAVSYKPKGKVIKYRNNLVDAHEGSYCHLNPVQRDSGTQGWWVAAPGSKYKPFFFSVYLELF